MQLDVVAYGQVQEWTQAANDSQILEEVKVEV